MNKLETDNPDNSEKDPDKVDIVIPRNWKFVDNILRNNQKETILIYTVSWNLKGEIATKEEVKALLYKPETFYHFYVINTQECLRSILSSFFNSNKDEWINMIK
jgi:hypothetical protein